MKVVNPIAKKGEDIAYSYLQKNSYKILERNFHIRGGEVDIIAIDTSEKELTLVFIEVKTRTSDSFGTPFEAITFWKLKSLIKTAQFYALKYPKLPQKLRIDAVSVFLHGNRHTVELMKNIS